MADWKELYDSRVMTAHQALQKITSGSRIFIGTGCGQPQLLVEELVSDNIRIQDAEIYHLLTRGMAPYIQEKYAHK